MPGAEVAVFGEVLFDQFPDGSRILGGAPFNVAWNLQAFGRSPRFVSRVGDDDEGRSILDAMRAWGMGTDDMQQDPVLPTGRVSVTLQDGQPAYDIVNPCAYDAIGPYAGPSVDLLYHGSLALRDTTSRAALEGLYSAGAPTVFLDVNLRSPWWDRATLDAALRRADWMKLNDEELALLGPTGGDDEAAVGAMFEHYGLAGLIVTYGADGALVMTRREGLVRGDAVAVADVVDTVGAGDAFASVCIVGIIEDWPIATMIERAQRFAARIVGQKGATSTDTELYASQIARWTLADG
jgi:fructokinase